MRDEAERGKKGRTEARGEGGGEENQVKNKVKEVKASRDGKEAWEKLENYINMEEAGENGRRDEREWEFKMTAAR